jgi:hypothetical protein
MHATISMDLCVHFITCRPTPALFLDVLGPQHCVCCSTGTWTATGRDENPLKYSSIFHEFYTMNVTSCDNAYYLCPVIFLLYNLMLPEQFQKNSSAYRLSDVHTQLHHRLTDVSSHSPWTDSHNKMIWQTDQQQTVKARTADVWKTVTTGTDRQMYRQKVTRQAYS